MTSTLTRAGTVATRSVRIILKSLAAGALALSISTVTHAAWNQSSVGTVRSVRTYPDAGTSGLRVEVQVYTATHPCGTDTTVYYFDASNLGIDATRSVLATATAAMLAERSIVMTYDCAMHSGGFGWGIGIQIIG